MKAHFKRLGLVLVALVATASVSACVPDDTIALVGGGSTGDANVKCESADGQSVKVDGNSVVVEQNGSKVQVGPDGVKVCAEEQGEVAVDSNGQVVKVPGATVSASLTDKQKNAIAAQVQQGLKALPAGTVAAMKLEAIMQSYCAQAFTVPGSAHAAFTVVGNFYSQAWTAEAKDWPESFKDAVKQKCPDKLP